MRRYKRCCSLIESHLFATQSNIENTNLLLFFIPKDIKDAIHRGRNIRATHGFNRKIVHGASFISQQKNRNCDVLTIRSLKYLTFIDNKLLNKLIKFNVDFYLLYFFGGCYLATCWVLHLEG